MPALLVRVLAACQARPGSKGAVGHWRFDVYKTASITANGRYGNCFMSKASHSRTKRSPARERMMNDIIAWQLDDEYSDRLSPAEGGSCEPRRRSKSFRNAITLRIPMLSTFSLA